MTFRHVGRSRLLSQQFLKVARARLHFVEQARVFDGDDGLVGEGLNEFDLLGVERANLGAHQSQHADRGAVAHHRNAEAGAEFASFSEVLRPIFGVGLDVFHLNRFAFQHNPPADRAPLGRYRYVADLIHELFGKPVRFCAVVDAVDLAGDCRLIGVAEFGRRLDQCVAAPPAGRTRSD